MPKSIPQIYGLGIYDASIVHKSKSATPPRLVSLYEIEYILEDGGSSHINGKCYEIRKGALIVAKPGDTRHTELPFRALFAHFLIEDTEICSMLDKCPDFFFPDNPGEYEVALRSLISEAASDLPFKDIRVCEKIFSLFSLLLSNAALYAIPSGERKSNSEVVKSAIEYMDSRFCEAITLDEIARHVHLSRIYFRSVFLAATGQTPYKYIRSKRLSKAKQLILTTDRTFSQIAVDCGFSSQSYMNSVFREEFDKTPKELREESSLLY